MCEIPILPYWLIFIGEYSKSQILIISRVVIVHMNWRSSKCYLINTFSIYKTAGNNFQMIMAIFYYINRKRND